MYQALWINQLYQFGVTTMDLILEDDAGELPPYRVSKKFRLAPEEITEDMLAEVVAEEVGRLVEEAIDQMGITGAGWRLL